MRKGGYEDNSSDTRFRKSNWSGMVEGDLSIKYQRIDYIVKV